MEYIDAFVFINLDRRTDRRVEFEDECKKMGISAIRFPAIERIPGMLGCHLSHLAVLKMAKTNKWKNVCIFEDDFMFLVSKEEFQKQLTDFFTSNTPYDVVMLSYSLQKSEPLNAIVGYAREAQTASGYIVHERFYDALIENLETAYEELEHTHAHWLYLNDQCWKSLQPKSEFLYFLQRIGKQRSGFSDLSNIFVDRDV